MIVKPETRPSFSIRNFTSVDMRAPLGTTDIGCSHWLKKRSCNMLAYELNCDARLRPLPERVPPPLPVAAGDSPASAELSVFASTGVASAAGFAVGLGV